MDALCMARRPTMPTRAAAAPVITIQWTQLPEWKLLVRYNLRFFVQVGHETTYRISLYSFRFRGNYFFLDLEIWREVTEHNCAETIQGRKLYEEIQYSFIGNHLFSPLNHVTIRPAEIIKPL